MVVIFADLANLCKPLGRSLVRTLSGCIFNPQRDTQIEDSSYLTHERPLGM
jgi:hypothetical protein